MVDDRYWTVSSDTYKTACARGVSGVLDGRLGAKSAATVFESDGFWAA